MKEVAVLPIHQWAESWDKAEWAPEEGLGVPPERFYMASMPLKELRALANVSRREISERKKGTTNPGYQRPRDEKRSERIGRYIDYGYPLSNQKSLNPDEHRDLIHPGWLPSAILINIIPPGQTRRRQGRDIPVSEEYEVRIKEIDGSYRLHYPDPQKIAGDSRIGKDFIEPIEVIDGQHRLYAADDASSLSDDYEVPVVIFEGLSEQW